MISVCDLDLHSGSLGCEKAKTSVSVISQSSLIDTAFLKEIQYSVICLISVSLNVFDMTNFAGREVHLHHFVKWIITFNTSLCLDAYELIFHILCMKTNTTKLDFDTSLIYLDLHRRSQGHKKSWTCAIILLQSDPKKPEYFGMIDYVRVMTARKSCTYGDYGSFEHLLINICHDRQDWTIKCLSKGTNETHSLKLFLWL